jgi:hypothetical protein
VSEQNVEIVRRAYAHTKATGRVHAQVIAPDFVWDMSKFPWPEQQLYAGAETTGRRPGKTGSSRLTLYATRATRSSR